MQFSIAEMVDDMYTFQNTNGKQTPVSKNKCTENWCKEKKKRYVSYCNIILQYFNGGYDVGESCGNHVK